MTPPRLVKVGALSYTVHHDQDRISGGDRGNIDAESNAIRIAPSLEASRKRVIVLHEVVHAVLEAAGWRWDDTRERGHEDVVNTITPGLLAVLRDNPDLVAYLREGS